MFQNPNVRYILRAIIQLHGELMKTKLLMVSSLALTTLPLSHATLAFNAGDCGSTITGKDVLTENVVCDTSSTYAVRLDDGGSLDLNGFVLSCNSDNNDGVLIDGKGAKLYNGTVGGSCDDGVYASSTGSKCQISNVLSTGHNDDGFEIRADGCKLTNNVALDNGDDGFVIFGSKNTLTGNLSRDNGWYGFSTSSGTEKNKLTSNTAAGNAYDGFEILGTGHKLQKNLSTDNEEEGYYINGDKHNLTQNRAFKNDLHGIANYASNTKIQKDVSSDNNDSGGSYKDMYEDTAGCGSNSWKSNVFGTSQDGGTSPSTCIQ